jgi:hypothetical protein
MSEITGDDLREAIRDVTTSMNRGFDGIHERLDELNGRTRKAENAIAVQEERWTRLDKATQITPPKGVSSADMGIRGDWKTLSLLGSAVAGAASGLIMGLYKVLQLAGVVK